LLFVKNGDMLKGSARSVEAVNIFEALKECSQYISEFGGHSQAAGVNITEENFPLLENALNEYLHAHYEQSAFTPTLYVSGTLKDNLSTKFVKELELLEPYGVGNKRPLFELDVCECNARPVKAQSPHLAVGCGVIDLMYFSGSRYEKLLACKIPKRIVFEYNVSVFRGKEYIKGFVRDVIYGNDAAKYVAEEIAFNNLSSAALQACACDVTDIDEGQANSLLADSEEYGTAYVVNDYSTLKRYSNAVGKDVNVFNLASKNLANTIIVSPLYDVDLSGYKRIVYLDNPAKITLSSLVGKQVFVCRDVCGTAWADKLDTDRISMLGVFKKLSANAYNLDGATAEELAIKNDLGCTKVQLLFCLKVFEELNLLAFTNGKLTINRGVKTELANSQLYSLVSSLSQRK
jgi:hypothetical protein